MTNKVQFSEVQMLNLSALMTIRDGVKQDPVSTCCRFGIAAAELEFFEKLTTEKILGIVAHFGQESLFTPRASLLSLLQLPLPLAGQIAATHPMKAISHIPAA